MHDDFFIRQARPGDIPGMCGLLSELFSIEADFTPDLEKQARGLSFLIGDKSGSSIVLVAEKDGSIIGMCSAQTLISTSEGGIVGLLEDLIVKKEYRGRGVGTRLISEIISWCKENNVSRLQLLRDMDNEKARDFYISRNWSDTRLICMRRFI